MDENLRKLQEDMMGNPDLFNAVGNKIVFTILVNMGIFLKIPPKDFLEMAIRSETIDEYLRETMLFGSQAIEERKKKQ